jgi:hypothetical protein
VVNKWLSHHDTLAIGDIVIIMDDPDRGFLSGQFLSPSATMCGDATLTPSCFLPARSILRQTTTSSHNSWFSMFIFLTFIKTDLKLTPSCFLPARSILRQTTTSSHNSYFSMFIFLAFTKFDLKFSKSQKPRKENFIT